MTYIFARLREPGTHTGIALLAAILLLAELTGLYLTQLTSSATGIATALGALAAAAKVMLPDTVP
jgi:hypothetical protein